MVNNFVVDSDGSDLVQSARIELTDRRPSPIPLRFTGWWLSERSIIPAPGPATTGAPRRTAARQERPACPALGGRLS